MIILSALCLSSCKKTIALKLDKTPAGIVIQGEVTNADGPYTVTINRSVNFYADNNFPAISGAVVKISDEWGLTDSLTETSPGVYTSHILRGRPGDTYSLTVFTGNTNYSAVSTMPEPVALDSINFESISGFGGDDRINAVVNFQDPAGIKNYYQFMETINGLPFSKDIFLFDDRLSDGKYIVDNLRMDSIYLHSGDLLEVKMNCLDGNIYNYFNQLARISGGGTFNTSASPANPSSNISNGAFGYFSAHTTQSKKISVY